MLLSFAVIIPPKMMAQLLPCSYIIMNNSDLQIRPQFLKSEASVGITKETFIQRFLYVGDPTSDNCLLDRCAPTPSQLEGLTIEQEKGIGYLMGEIIFRAGESLRIPVSTTVVAASIAHYFYSRAGFLQYDFRDVAMGATFLACKSEETLRKSFEVSAVFDQVFKVFEGQRTPVRVQVLNSPEYEYMRKKVIQMENEILFALGFEVYRLFDIPHRYIGGLFKTFDRHPQCRRICQLSWTHLNDFYRTNCSLFYPGPTIAAAAVYLALLKLGIQMPSVPWWVLMEAHLQGIEELVGQLEAFYEAASAHRFSLEWAAVQLNEVGDRHQLVNVFPVNYYRKIILETNSQLKIKKVLTPQQQPINVQNNALPITNNTNPITLPIQQKQQNIRSDDDSQSRQRSRDKRKKKEKSKKEKKDKRKKKEKRKRSQDSSKSIDRNKTKKRQSSDQQQKQPQPQLRNNDETPKVNKPSPMIPEPSEANNQPVKQVQAANSKQLLSRINSKLDYIKKQRQETTPMEIQQPRQEEVPRPQAQRSSSSNEANSDEDALAELIKIRKSRGKMNE